MTKKRYASYEEFWPFYLSQHVDVTCRRLHFVGTTIVYACLIAALVSRELRWLALAPLAGYGFAWAGHFIFEKNRPATFTYPLWSLRADFRMHRRMLLRRRLVR